MGFFGMSHGGFAVSMLLLLLLLLLAMVVGSVSGIGANWGTQATHPLPHSTVVQMLKDNGFQKVKLFDADSNTLNALSGSGLEVMVGIPNDMLDTLANSVAAAEKWVEKNVSVHVSSNKVDIRYVAVGNEPFLATYNGTFLGTTFPALQNIQAALIKAGLGNQVKVTIPLNADVYQTSTTLPSGGDFRPDIHDLMLEIVKFLNDNGGPFTVNIYPFISLYLDSNFPVDYAFFDGYSSPINDNGKIYDNVFDANHDTLVWALQKNGYANMSIIVGEIGWPTDGDRNANANLIDEDAKSIQPGNFERHWGIFNYDGTPKYNLTLVNSSNSGGLVAARNVQYLAQQWCVMSSTASLDDSEVAPSVSFACSHADCTSLGYGTTVWEFGREGEHFVCIQQLLSGAKPARDCMPVPEPFGCHDD
ncbi:hypothetical protein HYC85_027540 [Camellia sinensis]|uniref:Glucan endo-1,3-beta-D-glucosidase n=1 Tax=Camellia sinensis TaxID=4442 RepID=A0A7J7G915_CAMSI|nr:hypothetical protein HYC85_027540 [Camellia sinensis]